jgi:antitoxin (DNA-binding transcriptional repressor) of toxin-antitoxin stability system
MIRVAAEQFAADTATYLDRVERGEEVWIERSGQVVARLVAAQGEAGYAGPPAQDVARNEPVESPLAREFRRLRQGNRLDGLTMRELIDEGRR